MNRSMASAETRWKANGGEKPPEVNVGEDERAISALAGGVLALYGLNRPPGGLLLTALGGALIYRGLSGRSVAYRALGLSSTGAGALPAPKAMTIERSVTINRPRAELYSYWRNFEQLPSFMQHLESVRSLDDRRSHWVAKAPLGTSVEWDAEITEDRPNELIAWRSTEEAQVPNAGQVRFEDAIGGQGTVVRVRMEYTPPGGTLGALVALVTGEEPHKQVADDLRNFKAMIETGEVPTTKGQPSGRKAEQPEAEAESRLARAENWKEQVR